MLTVTAVLGFILGIYLCIKGADFLMTFAGIIKQRTGMADFYIGVTLMTVVTTLPETIVSLLSAMSGDMDLSIGSAIGSMIFNICVVLAIYLLGKRVHIQRNEMLWQSLFLFIVLGLVIIFSLNNFLGVGECIFLFLMFAVFLVFNNPELQKKEKTNLAELVVEIKSKVPVWLLVVLGVCMLLVGSGLVVSQSLALGQVINVPQNIMAIVLVAGGISLPEFFIAISAVKNKQSKIGFGNIVGSCILNCTMLLGLSGLVSGGLVISYTTLMLSLPFIMLVSLLALLPVLISKKTSKIWGIILMILYVVYVVILCG